MLEPVRLALVVAAKDIRAELRSKTALLSALVFAALVLVIFNFARDPTALAATDLAPSALWVTFAFAAMVAMNRAFTVEREHGALDALLLAPVPRGALFWGKLLANLAFVAAVEAVALPLFVLFFNVDLGGALPGIIGTAALATVGFVAVGTIFGAMAVRTRFAELMLPVLLLPFMVPPLVGAVQVTARLLAARPLSEMLGWLRLLALYDVVFLTLCTLAFRAVVDE
ncbi:MAG TPA: heme exporter protein CcmB [Gemmatimonadales bacterium]|jgi:heme exporter protein B|nr:heme exporter protein CcmB [Gemmatimonadales bacterium]